MKRFEMLGHDALQEDLLASFVERMEKNVGAIDAADNRGSKETSIGSAVNFSLLAHLQMEVFDDIAQKLSVSLKGTTEFFESEWWCADGGHSNQQIEPYWVRVLHYGIFSGGILQNWEAVSRICSRFDRQTPLEISDSDPDEYFQFWICVTQYLNKGSCESVADLYESVGQCRLKKVRLLKQCLDSIMSGDQKEFDKALRDLVKRELPAIKKAGGFNFWVSMEGTVLWLIAEHAGLAFPKLNDQCSAAVVRRDTIGLA